MPGPQSTTDQTANGTWSVQLITGLKSLLKRTALLFGVVFTLAWLVREELMALVKWPLVAVFPEVGANTIFLRVNDAFIVDMKLCFYVALIAVAPVLVMAAWKASLKRWNGKAATEPSSAPVIMIVLFFVGILFAFLVALPAAFGFLVAYSMEGEGYLFTGGSLPTGDVLQISISEHVSFTMKLAMAFGFAFQSPVVMVMLAKMGLVTSTNFAKQRGVALVVMAIGASFLTPPDPWTLLLLLGPLMALYELGIHLARRMEEKP